MPRAGLTRERLVEAAASLADEEGFEMLTLAALARHFDVKLASLYSHVANIDDLKAGIALLALSALADRAEEAVAGRAGRDALVALADAHRSFALEHPGLFAAARFPLDPASAATSGGAQISRICQAALRAYGLSETDRVHAVRLIGSFFLGFSLLESCGSFSHSQPEAETSWTRSLDGFDMLFRSWAVA